MLKVEQLKNNSGTAVKNQFVIKDSEKNTCLFQSYDSPIISVDFNNHKIEVYPDYKYSRNTSKYRNEFLNNLGFYEINSTKDLDTSINDKCVEINECVYSVEYKAV